jgi:predicted acyl esterase
VDGPDGPALLQAAIGEHQANVDMQKLLGRAAFSDDCLPGLDWQATTPADVRQAIEATGVPMLIRAGWLDGAFAAGALRRLATFANQQEVEIGPWGHGGGTYADTLRPDGTLAGDLHVAGFPVISLRLATSGSDGAIYAYLQDVAPDGTVTYLTEGCLRFLHRATTGPAEPTRLGVPRSFAQADRLAVEPG